MLTISPTASLSEDAVYAKVGWRLIPLLFLCYIAAFLDRVNVYFAKLQMQSDVAGLSDTVYGLGAGIFFIGYFLFEVPSNLLLEKFGARVWIARIMVSWGIISSATLFVNSPEIFYVLRFLLGVAEAGFFPGIILYLTYWFPSRRRGRMVAFFMTAIAMTGVVGGAAVRLDSSSAQRCGEHERLADAFLGGRNSFYLDWLVYSIHSR